MAPEAADRIIPANPWDETRARYADLAAADRPGNPTEFDPREEPRRYAIWIVLGAVLLIGGCFICAAGGIVS